jgi:hypothetical protein
MTNRREVGDDRQYQAAAAAPAAHATVVDFLSAVGHAVAAGAGGVAAPAHAARVTLCRTKRRVRWLAEVQA